jgi:hypothetical protein
MTNDQRRWTKGEITDPIGLCRTCAHAKVITTPRGSTFYLCLLSETDPRFPKYPVLPVEQCGGYIKK